MTRRKRNWLTIRRHSLRHNSISPATRPWQSRSPSPCNKPKIRLISSSRIRAPWQLDQANVETAQLNLGYCHIESPIIGRAGVLLIDLGNLVGPVQ